MKLKTLLGNTEEEVRSLKKKREKEVFYNEVEINYRDEKGLRRAKARLSERYDVITRFILFSLKIYYQY